MWELNGLTEHDKIWIALIQHFVMICKPSLSGKNWQREKATSIVCPYLNECDVIWWTDHVTSNPVPVMSFDGQIMSHQIWYLCLRSMMSFDGKTICHQIWYLCLTTMTSLMTQDQALSWLFKAGPDPKRGGQIQPLVWTFGWTSGPECDMSLNKSSLVQSRPGSSQPVDWTGAKMD